VLLQHIYIIII